MQTQCSSREQEINSGGETKEISWNNVLEEMR